MNKTTFTKFPFGKYAGINIKDLPTQYITYAIMTFALPPDLLNEMFDEIMDRFSDRIMDQVDENALPFAIRIHKNMKGGDEL